MLGCHTCTRASIPMPEKRAGIASNIASAVQWLCSVLHCKQDDDGDSPFLFPSKTS
jgi:hypothetical protein